ncbi:hypothetical protein NDU88_004893 [Pleurodeles waltl]|uniref:Uncharacterized protein n=1 Tax=Pleurodeles waltl TaxID=8319 RepID=A0AAV7VLM9_PLEWA|nr:hypothetical protein NDU88_004893 [Pleurodeles waltl]
MCCNLTQSYKAESAVQGDSTRATTTAVSFGLARGHPGLRCCYPGYVRCLLTYSVNAQSGFSLWSLAASLSHQARSTVVPSQTAPFKELALCYAQDRCCPGGARVFRQGPSAPLHTYRALGRLGPSPAPTALRHHHSIGRVSKRLICGSVPVSRVRRLWAECSCSTGFLPVNAADSPRGAISAPIAPRHQESVPSLRALVHDDRPIRDLYLRPLAGHIKKDKSEAQTEP